MRKYAANIITGSRIIFCILMLSFPVFSFWFFVMYCISGFTDMIDGWTARKTKSASVFGSHLDTFADFVFVSTALLKILPAIDIPKGLLVLIFLIAIIKIANIILGFIRKKGFIAEHTVMNKITGFLLFLLPLTFKFKFFEVHCSAVVCLTAIAAALQEGYFIGKGEDV